MSPLASSRNVQWSAEGATNWIYSRAQDKVNLSSFRSAYFDEKTKDECKIFEKNGMYFWQKNEDIILDD